MEPNVYETRRKKSANITMARMLLAIAFVAVGLGMLSFGLWQKENDCVVIGEDKAFYGVRPGTYVEITTADFYDSRIVAWKDADKEKVSVYYYFVFNGDEVLVAGSKRDYTRDPEGVVRTFKGYAQTDTDRGLEAENLAVLTGESESDCYAWLPPNFISTEKPKGGSASVDFYGGAMAMLMFFGAAIALAQLAVLRAGKKIKKRMEGYNVNEMAVRQFEQELYCGRGQEFGKLTLTDNWLFNRATGRVALFPLREIVWIYQKVVQTRYNGIPAGKTFSLEIQFSDGGNLSLPLKKSLTEQALAAFAARCPQALLGFSDERATAWAKDKALIIRASRGKAMELARGPEREEETEETGA